MKFREGAKLNLIPLTDAMGFDFKFDLQEQYQRVSCKIMEISQELSDALHTSGDSELEVVDPQTQRRYVLIDSETHRRAMDALRREQDREAIAEGLAQMEAGHGQPLDEAFADLRSRLGFPQPK